MDGKYIPSRLPSPLYVFSSNSYLNSPDHFFISVTLHFPNRKPLKTFALVDSGASASCISDSFSKRHSLPRRLKDVPIPIMAVDDRPIASGLVTQDVLTNLAVDAHEEVFPLNVVSVSYPIILGLDWLRRHNPYIDWEDTNLSLACCNLSRSHPITVKAKGFGPRLPHLTTSLNSLSMTSLGLGFGLNSGTLTSRPSLVLTPCPTLPEHSANASLTPNILDPSYQPPSLFSSLPGWTGFGRSTHAPSTLENTGPPKVTLLNPRRFTKYAKDAPIALLRFNSNPISIATTSTSDSDLGPDDDAPSSPEEWMKYVPEKYFAWSSVFSPVAVDQLPPHRPYDMSIELEEGSTPPFGPMYRLSQAERDALSEYIEANLKKGFIRRSISPAASPILFVRKKTGDLRLCVDYRGLNAITKKNRYPLPLIVDLLDRVQGCTVFTVLDLKNAFNLIRIKDGDEWKTAFRTPLGLYEYLVMPFGLTNAPATFQALIQDTLRDFLDIFCVVYLDDILIFSHSQVEHDSHVQQVLDRLKGANLFANAQKCEFDKSQVGYLGYLISADGIRMDPKKLETISHWPEPRSVRDIQSFLGFTNFYRRFVDHYAQIVLPLNQLTCKDVPFDFTDSCCSAFNKLKSIFTSYPVLHHFDPSLTCTLSTDASNFAISGVLQQPDSDNHLHPIAYYSRKLSPAEINYDVYDKELLGVVESFRDMRAWLHSSDTPVHVISDHKNLEYFMTSRILNRRQARWSLFLSEFNFRLVWGPSVKNVADSPSRRSDFSPQKGDDVLEQQYQTILTPTHTELLFPTPVTPPSNSIPALTTLSIDNSVLLERFKAAFREDTEWQEAVARGNSDFHAQDGMVFHKGHLFVPSPLRANILHSRHDALIAGHPGRTRTLAFVQRDYSWPGIQTYVRRYVQACDTCARIKTPRHKPYGLLQPLEIPTQPWKSITMDFIVKLPISHGYDSIWVVCDRLTRAAHFVPCKESMTASELAWLFLDHIFHLYGIPESIISDRGSLFVSKFWSELTTLLQIDHRSSTAYHPQMDGLTERTNQTLETYLRAYCSYQQDDWVDYLPVAEFAFNNAKNSSTKQSPFFANLAYHPTFKPQLTERSTVPAAHDLAQRLDHIHAELRAELQHAQEQQSKYFNQHVQESPQYQPDQLVWLLRRNIKTTRPSNKLDHRRLGPFPIERRLGPLTYQLRLPSYLSRLHPVFHVSLLEPYSDPSEFHPHASPEPFDVVSDSPVPIIHSILDFRKIGHRYEYFVHFLNLPDSEDSWIPLSDIPTSSNELITRFHRRHSRAPRPHQLVLDQTFPAPPVLENPVLTELTDTVSTSTQELPVTRTEPAASSSSVVPLAAAHPASPPVILENLRTAYVPAAQTTLSSGRVSRPPSRLDPPIPPRKRRR